MSKRDRYTTTESPLDQGVNDFPTAENIYRETKPGIPRRVDTAQLQQQIQQLQEQLATQAKGGLLTQDGGLMLEGFQFSPTGLIAPEQITQESWEQVGLLLFRLEGSIQWLIGDWLAYGADLKYGDIDEIAASLGREPETLHQYAYVCRNIRLWIRIHNLSYGHHKLVAPLPEDEQSAALAHAAQEGLSVAAFRKYLRGEQPAPALPSGDMPDLNAVTRDVQKFMHVDPAALKPKQFQAAQTEVQARLRELAQITNQITATLRQRWGLDE